MSTNHRNYLSKHWHGEHSLPRSYWINGFLLNVIIAIGTTAFVYELNFDDNPKFAAYSAIFIWVGVSLVTIWQVVGIWRSANNYSKQSKRIWGRVAQVFTVLGVLGFASTITTTAIPQIKEFWLIASGNDPLGQFQLRVLRDATELEFSGHIGFGATEKVEEYLTSHPAIKLIHLNSPGGRVESARKLASLIEARGLSTYTSKECLSACIISYAAGAERLIEKNARLGFHQYTFPGLDQSDFYSEYVVDRRYLLSRGIGSGFIDRIFDTPPDEMWEPSHEELLQANFITKYPDYDDVAISNVTFSDADSLEKVLLNFPLYQAVKDTDPAASNKILETIQVAVERGHSLADVREITMPIIAGTLFGKLSKTSDEALLEFAQIKVDGSSYLQAKNPYQCYAYAMGTYDVRNKIDTGLSDDLRKREIESYSNIISGYSDSIKVPSEEEVVPHLEDVLFALATIHGDNVDLLSKETHSREEQPILCGLSIDFYKEILRLEHIKAVKVLRYILQVEPDTEPFQQEAVSQDDAEVNETRLEDTEPNKSLTKVDARYVSRDKHGRTPLHLAARNGELKLVESLLKYGADIEARDDDGDTPLHQAAYGKQPEIISLLLNAGANIAARSEKGGATALHRAAYKGIPTVIAVLLDADADIEVRMDEHGWTPLHIAAESNETTEAVALLLDRGADIEIRDDYGDTPLHRSVAYSETPEVVALLLDRGADMEARDKYAGTPLHNGAAYSKTPEILALLLDRGADIEARDDDGETPLHRAAEDSETPDVVALLLDAGANIEARTEWGGTPLHAASLFSETPEVVALLLDRGADIEARDTDGWTPLHAATKESKTSAVIELLLDRGANVNVQDINGQTPFDLIKENESLKKSKAYWKLNEAQYQ